MQKLALSFALLFAVIAISLAAPAKKIDEQLEELLANNMEQNHQTEATMQQDTLRELGGEVLPIVFDFITRRVAGSDDLSAQQARRFLDLSRNQKDAILQQFRGAWPWGDFQNPFNFELPTSASMRDSQARNAISQRNSGNWPDFFDSFALPKDSQDATGQRFRNIVRGLGTTRDILNSLPFDQQRAMLQRGSRFWDSYNELVNNLPFGKQRATMQQVSSFLDNYEDFFNHAFQFPQQQDMDTSEQANQVKEENLAGTFPFQFHG